MPFLTSNRLSHQVIFKLRAATMAFRFRQKFKSLQEACEACSGQKRGFSHSREVWSGRCLFYNNTQGWGGYSREERPCTTISKYPPMSILGCTKDLGNATCGRCMNGRGYIFSGTHCHMCYNATLLNLPSCCAVQGVCPF